MSEYVYIWEYIIKSNYLEEFKSFYNPIGIWSEFFRTSPNYLKTELLVDCKDEFKFTTIDYWISKECFDEFMHGNKNRYQDIDNKCNKFTIEERKIGEYHIVSL